uniref:uncharacterized protein LOC122581642 n=1 Tax=Erigeron canadensis TaxID=72917 RepID=UPI001CB97F4C|nr:uncharacterized protein LOC122581642 [Erigeron canadensis]
MDISDAKDLDEDEPVVEEAPAMKLARREISESDTTFVDYLSEGGDELREIRLRKIEAKKLPKTAKQPTLVGLVFRGHNEKKESSNRGNILELLEWLAKYNEIVREVLKRAPRNHKMIAPSVQKDLINSCAKETTSLIVEDVGDNYFAILVDESSDVCHKEQMALYLRKEMLREAQAQHVLQVLDDDELQSGKGKNQELGLVRPYDTRWGSYYKLLANVVDLYPVICKVLDNIEENSSVGEDKAKADAASYAIESFDFIFMVLRTAERVHHQEEKSVANYTPQTPKEFPSIELHRLDDQLDLFINDMRTDESFTGLKDIRELCRKLVEVNKHGTFDHVYLLIKLVLILPVATASVERAFSAMTYVKNKLRNRMGDQLLNDCLVTFIEKDIFSETSDDNIL